MRGDRAARAFGAALALVLAAGCATGRDPRDPLEGFNRAMYRFNDGVDQAIAKPVATAYKAAVPDLMRDWVRNFFANIGDVFIGVNNLLQGKPIDALSDWARVGFNTTFGLLGIADVASELGIDKHNEDFGQTLGAWGVPSGPYVVLPFFGPSTLRDTAGLTADTLTDPLTRHKPVRERNAATALRYTGVRADLLGASDILDEAALDKYSFQRDAWLQRRRSQIYDGSPPREADPAAESGENGAGAAVERSPATPDN
ncbi:MAG: VacJ family lipoprotein [Betaproteobacteria bacterium]|nr:VacJ family lipoprotein [Betaproteobacteria bacterium]